MGTSTTTLNKFAARLDDGLAYISCKASGVSSYEEVIKLIEQALKMQARHRTYWLGKKGITNLHIEWACSCADAP